MFLTKMKLAGAVFLTLAAGAAVLGYQGSKGPGGREPADQGTPAAVVHDPGAIKNEPPPSRQAPDDWIARLANPDPSPGDEPIVEAIDKPIAMNFPNDTPLEDIIEYIRKCTDSPNQPGGIPIYVDPQGLQDADKTMASTVSINNLDGIPLRITLKLALKQVGLVYEVKNGMLYITAMSSEDHPSVLTLATEKAERGELTLEQYQELVEILKLRNEVAKLIQEKRKIDGPGGFQ